MQQQTMNRVDILESMRGVLSSGTDEPLSFPMFRTGATDDKPLSTTDAALLTRIRAIKVVSLDLARISEGIDLLGQIQAQETADVISERKRLYNGRSTLLLQECRYEESLADISHVLSHPISIGSEFDLYALRNRAQIYEIQHRLEQAEVDRKLLVQLAATAFHHRCQDAKERQVMQSVAVGSILDLKEETRKLANLRELIENAKSAVTWRQLSHEGPPRCFHSTVLHPDGTCLVVYGGSIITDRCNQQNLSDVFLFHFQSKKWTQQRCSGPQLATASHSAMVYGRHMYVLGGSLPDFQEFKQRGDSHVGVFRRLDLDTYEWTNLRYSTKLKVLKKFSMNCWNGQMVVYGGDAYDRYGVWENTAAMQLYDFKRKKWSLVHYNNNATLAPHKRSLHASWIWNDCLYIYGGCKHEANGAFQPLYQDDVHCFDLKLKLWTGPVELVGKLRPTPRAEVSAAALNNRLSFVFGGYAERASGSHYYGTGLRFAHRGQGKLKCYDIEMEGSTHPPALSAGTMTSDQANNRCLFYGGYNTMHMELKRGKGVSGELWELVDSKKTRMGACEVCNQAATKRCSKCMDAFYCSSECQHAHWPNHRRKCCK